MAITWIKKIIIIINNKHLQKEKENFFGIQSQEKWREKQKNMNETN